MRAVAMVIALAGCSSSIVTANARGGVINAPFTPNGWSEAAKRAEAECRKFDRVSVVQSRNMLDNTLRYECVEP
jgi:hypothetical protein